MDFLDYREKLNIAFDDEEKIKYLMVKIFNVLDGLATEPINGSIDFNEYFAFCNTTGSPMDHHLDSFYDDNNRFKHCVNILKAYRKDFKEFLARYVAFANAVKVKKHPGWTREQYINLIVNMMEDAHIPYELLKDKEEFFLFPKGAPEMDAALVSQPLNWLINYPKTHRAFVKALKEYADATPTNASDIADKFRKCLESFMQEFFSTEKSLENCKPLYGGYLKAQGVPADISNNLETLLQSYTRLMNDYAKHQDRTSVNVLEYIMYQTGNIIRLLVTLKINEK